MADLSPNDGQELKKSSHRDNMILRSSTKPSMASDARSGPSGAEAKRTFGSRYDALEVDWDSAKVPKTNRAIRGTARGMGRSKSSGRLAEGSKGSVQPFLKAAGDTVVVDVDVEVVPQTVSGDGGRIEVENLDTDTLRTITNDGVQEILEVCRTSGNLKGTYIKTLKKAANSLREVVEALLERTATAETARLGRETRVLRQQVEDLKKEVLAWRREASARQVMPPPPPPPPVQAEVPPTVQAEAPSRDWEQMLAEGFERVERSIKILDARFDSLEVDGRLLPKKVLRPPLAGDKGPANNRPVAGPRPASLASEGKRPRSGSRAKSDRVRSVSRARPDRAGTPAPTQQPLGMEWAALPATAPACVPAEAGENEMWTTVVRRPKKAKAAPVVPATPAPKKRAQPKVPSAPRSAAVLITLQPEAVAKGVSYTAAVLKARETVGLAGLGIEDIKLRTTATGARLIGLLKCFFTLCLKDSML